MIGLEISPFVRIRCHFLYGTVRVKSIKCLVIFTFSQVIPSTADVILVQNHRIKGVEL